MATLSKYTDQVASVSSRLMKLLTKKTDRRIFFSNLSRLIQQQFHFDRLCINLYDRTGEMLAYFTAAEGTVISTLSPIRPAEMSSTVAGHVIATKKPVIITDFAQYFSESSMHPFAEAGLTTTMAFPLILDNEIIATMHCSFAEQPADMYGITNFMLGICPAVATCLGAILSLEHLRFHKGEVPLQPLFFSTSDDTVICHSPAMREVMRKVTAAAKLEIPILLLGETGSGKSLIAQDIHRRSLRSSERFVKVNCPALPQTLFESELFGHTRGAFTGADSKRMGRFELAHGGTLFLDEIGELSPEIQSKLLQVLEDASFERVGESLPFAVDVRIISATNIHIREAITQGIFRADLFYRISPCVIELPPLRERKEDIDPLIAAFLAQLTTKLNMPGMQLGKILKEPLYRYDWPGNVRQLRNVITKLLVHRSMHGKLELCHVEQMLEEEAYLNRSFSVDSSLQGGGEQVTLAAMEREHILQALRRTGGVIAGPKGAAVLLGVPRSTLVHKIKKLGIEK